MATQAAAQSPAIVTNQPAATLLLPYFEVDLDNPDGINTLFSLNNASASAGVGHVTIWSDMGVPVFAFDVYLTGYDAQPLDMRAILLGTLPKTADAGIDPTDTISNKGPLSQDINFPGSGPGCGIRFDDAQMTPYIPYLREALTGNASSFHGGRCVARNHGTPGIARGYVTIDSVTQCSAMFPSDVGYGLGVLDTRNIFWGDYTYVNPSQDLSYGDSLVHVTANTAPGAYNPGDYTFYGRFNAWTAADRREPLGAVFAARFVAPKDFKTPAKARRRAVLPPSTELVVWRDTKVANVNSFACGTTPAWYPLSQEQVMAFDEQENAESLAFATPPFPAATQKVTLGGSSFPLTASEGWLFLNLNTLVPGSSGPADGAAAQAWVTVLQRVQQGPNGGRYDVGYRALRLESAGATSHAIIQ